MSAKIKFATALEHVEMLAYYDRPFVELVQDPTTSQHFVAIWADEDDDWVKWYVIPVTAEQIAHAKSTCDKSDAEWWSPLLSKAETAFMCKENTYDYTSVLEGIQMSTSDITDVNFNPRKHQV